MTTAGAFIAVVAAGDGDRVVATAWTGRRSRLAAAPSQCIASPDHVTVQFHWTRPAEVSRVVSPRIANATASWLVASRSASVPVIAPPR